MLRVIVPMDNVSRNYSIGVAAYHSLIVEIGVKAWRSRGSCDDVSVVVVLSYKLPDLISAVFFRPFYFKWRPI